MPGTLAAISQTGECLSFIDIDTGSLITKLTNLPSEPHELCYEAKRNRLYISHTYRHGHYWVHGTYSHEISVVDIATKTVVDIIDTRSAEGPHGLYLDQTGDRLYASVERLPGAEIEGGGVIAIDLEIKEIEKKVPSGYSSHWFVMTPDAKKAYCCNKTARFISVLDLEIQKMMGKIEVPGCEEPSISLDGRFVYFPTPGFRFGKNPETSRIEVIDTTTDTIVKSIELEKGTLPVLVSPDGTILAGHYRYGEEGKNSASLGMYDPTTYESLGEVPVGNTPLTMRCSMDGKTALVANAFEGTVSVVDLVSKSLIRTIAIDTERRTDKPGHIGAHGLAYIG